MDLQTSVQYVRGVGPARAAEFAKLGVLTVGDLVEHFPFRHELSPRSQPIDSLELGQTATVLGGITDVRQRGTGRNPRVVARVEDGTGRCRVTWFNAPYLLDRLRRGQTIRLTGKVDCVDDWAAFTNPRFTLVDDENDPLADDMDRLDPVYSATSRLASKQIAKAVETALALAGPQIAEFLPDDLRSRRKLPPRRAAVERYHHPTRAEDVPVARRRLAYDELLLMQLAVLLRRREAQTNERAKPNPVSDQLDLRIRARLPFELTPGQNQVVAEIVADLARDRPMNRLLQADVGAGKTAVGVYAALAVVANRRQVAFLAPTEILAEQHYRKVERYLAGSRVGLTLLTGSLSRKKRDAAYAALAAGEIDFLIGTHALMEEGVTFPDLGLVIVDEQHRFGVAQRATLRGKGECPHYLVLTATPIPRTLAMTFFGDLDVSTIEGLPPGRPPVETRLVRPADTAAAWAFVRNRVGQGDQVFVVYPLVEESDSSPLKAATVELDRLQSGPLGGCTLELLHGRMKAADKDRVMNRFREGRIDVLVATTVVEVGIDVPNATVMVIEHAERYGLSQLHQLRGRIGRGTRPSYCLLMSDAHNEQASARLQILCRTRDGFRIAEEDLVLRGPGEMLGTRQHGLPALKVANLIEDVSVLAMARDDAAAIIAEDPTLAAPAHRGLRRAVLKRFGEAMRLVDVA